MGLILPGAGVASSGKVGGVVYSKNRYGAYARARVVPTNPSSSRQVSIRTLFGNISKAWRSTLTAGQRTAWTAWSQTAAWINRLGGPIVLSGNAAYTACNTLRTQLGQARVDTAPITAGFATLTVPGTITISNGGAISLIGLTAADPWNVVGGSIGLFIGNQVSNAVTFYKGPYKLAGQTSGTSSGLTNFTSGAFAGVATGQYRALRIAGTDSQGRLTNVLELAPAVVV